VDIWLVEAASTHARIYYLVKQYLKIIVSL